MKNEPLARRALELMQTQNSLLSEEFGILYTQTEHIVKHDNLEHKEKTQDKVNSLIRYSLILYLFAIWDNFVCPEMFDKWLTEEEKLRFLAYKHIRHSAAHRHNGTRADNNRPQFEKVMNSKNPLKGIAWNKEQDRIFITSGQISHDCLILMNDLSTKLFYRLANDRKL